MKTALDTAQFQILVGRLRTLLRKAADTGCGCFKSS
jgi:hypothetical protein